MMNRLKFFLGIAPFAVIMSVFFSLAYHTHLLEDDVAYVFVAKDQGLFRALLRWWTSFHARTFSDLIITFNSLYFGNPNLHGFEVMAIISLTFYSIYFLLGKTKLFDRKNQILMSSILMCLQFCLMPDLTQGIYWLAGSATYHVPTVMTNFLIGLLLMERQSQLRSIVIGLLIPCLAFSSEPAMIIQSLIFFIFFIHNMKKEKALFWWINGLLIFICNLTVLLNTGSKTRMTTYFNNTSENVGSLSFTFIESTKFSAYYIFAWGTRNFSVILISILFFLLLFKKNRQKLSSRFYFPIWFYAALLFVFMVVALTPYFYGAGKPPLGRVLNENFHFFILLWFFFVVLLKEKWNWQFETLNMKILNYKQYGKAFLIVLITFSFFRQSNFRSAKKDLLSGRAANYDQMMKLRFEIFEQKRNTSSPVILPKIENVPSVNVFRPLSINYNKSDSMLAFKALYKIQGDIAIQ